MTIYEMTTLAQNGLIGLVIILLGLIKLPKIEINLWTALARVIGRALNGEMVERIEKVDSSLTAHMKKTEEERINEARRRILRFSDEVLYEQGHSKEHYDEILEDIDKYEFYCANHPEFKNNKAVMAIETIKDAYQDCIENHDFLKYKKEREQ